MAANKKIKALPCMSFWDTILRYGQKLQVAHIFSGEKWSTTPNNPRPRNSTYLSERSVPYSLLSLDEVNSIKHP